MANRRRTIVLVSLAVVSLAFAYSIGIPSRGDPETPRGDLPLDVEELEVSIVANLLEDNRIQLLDARTEAEVDESSIPGAIWIPLADLQSRAPAIDSFPELEDSVPIVVYCRSGVRSLTAARLLRQAGFERSYSLTGGIRAWEESGYPLYFGERPD